MTAKLPQIAILGCGAVTQYYYLPALITLTQLGLLKVNTVIDPDDENSRAVLQYFPDSKRVHNLNDLNADNTDLAIIATPNSYHAQQALALLENNIHVLVEKPLATDLESAKAMVARAETRKKILAVGLIRRFFPACQSIKNILASGILGAVQSFQFSEGGPFQWSLRSPALFQASTAGGGIFLDIGSHALDLMLWWLGDPQTLEYNDDAMGGLEANCLLKVKYAQGLTGEIRLSRDWQLANTYEINCEKGWLSWTVGDADHFDFGINDSQLAWHNQVHKLSPSINADSTGATLGLPAGDFRQAFCEQLLNVLAAVAGKAPLMVSGQEALRGLTMIDNCYRQRSLLPMPWLSEPELERALALNTQILNQGVPPC